MGFPSSLELQRHSRCGSLHKRPGLDKEHISNRSHLLNRAIKTPLQGMDDLPSGFGVSWGFSAALQVAHEIVAWASVFEDTSSNAELKACFLIYPDPISSNEADDTRYY